MVRALPRRAMVALLTAAAMILSLVSLGVVSSTPARAAGTTMSLANFDGDDALVAIATGYGDAGGAVTPYGAPEPLVPSTDAGTHGFKVGYDRVSGTQGYAGWVVVFNSAADLTGFDGIQFWFHGDGLGANIQVELKDASQLDVDSNPELWDYFFVDNTAGWRQIIIPFTEFQFATDYQPAVGTDGVLDISAISEIALPVDTGSGVFWIDQIEAFSDATVTPSLSISSTNISVTEGVTANVPLRLSVPASTDVTVDVATVNGTAIAGTDFTAINTTITIPAGTQNVNVPVNTLDNTEVDGNRNFTLVISNVTGANLGSAATANITIRDDEVPEASANTTLGEVFEDFELPLVQGDAASNPLGWFPVNGGTPFSYERTDALPGPIPNSPTGNHAMKFNFNSSSWAVAIHNFTDGSNWVTQDWSLYDGIGFWMFGKNSGLPLFVDILDNRNPSSTGLQDTAERFTAEFVDDWNGWKFVELPFSDMRRKTEAAPNGAPDDGFTLSEIHGYAFGVGQKSPAVADEIFIDDVTLIHLQKSIDDLEGAFPTGAGGDVPPTGWFSVGDWWAPAFELSTTPPVTAPGTEGGNHVLKVDMGYQPWNAVAHHFVDGGSWVSQDWTHYENFGFWMYGQNSGAQMYFDLVAQRNPGSTTDDAARYSMNFVDDQLGWHFVTLPFDQMNFKWIGNGAPEGDIDLSQVHGFAIGMADTTDEGTIELYFDNFTVFGSSGENLPKNIGFSQSTYYVTEGDVLTATIKLSRVLENDVTVNYEAIETPDVSSTEDPMAVAGRDFTPVSGTVTIPAGQQTATIQVQTIDDTKPEVDETFSLVLSNSVGADLNPFTTRALVSIRDNDPRDPKMIEDFEDGIGLYRATPGTDLDIIEVPGGGFPAYEDADLYEQVLALTNNGAITRKYAQPVDWSGNEGIGFWYKGTGNGQSVTLEIEDDKAADPGPDGWTLAWSDEFNEAAGTVPDSTVWTHETGGWGWGNGEFQYYTPEGNNAFHDGDGNMVITMREIDDPASFEGECHYGDCIYTSARLVTENKYEFMYGRVETRALVPEGQGMWPAIWSLGNDFREVGWPQTGEIDFMEFVGKEPNQVFGTVHGPGYEGGQSIGGIKNLSEPVFADWHEFAIEWEPGEIRWYLDGEEFFSVTPADLSGREWVFDHPFVLIMNMAIGGNFGGAIDPGLTFPKEFKVDYIRVYQGPDTAERFQSSFVDDQEGWRLVYLPFEDFQRSSTQPDGAPNNGLTLSGVNGFSLRVGAPASVDPQISVAALNDSSVLVDRIQLFEEAPDVGSGSGDGDGNTGGDGDGDGSGSGDGTGADGGGAGDGELPRTGVEVWLLGLVSLLLALGGVVMVRTRRS